MTRLFGTDGVRGLANRDLTAELALNLAVTAAHVLADSGEFAGHRPKAIVGRDTRASGEFLEAAVVAGLASAGVDVYRVGVLPTPAIAFLTASTKADLGVMLSASHNPMPDNGIKFFARGGNKLADATEDLIANRLGEDWQRPIGEDVGRVIESAHLADEYVTHLLGTISIHLEGLKVVVDGANGAAAVIAPEVFRRAGAQVIEIHCQPDGLNINQNCGSTHLQDLQQAVVEHGADLGIGHDGDADRCLAVDANGDVVDGDQIIAIMAIAFQRANRLSANTVVSTVMANLGFKLAMHKFGIDVVETAVGDRYVLEAMAKQKLSLGGEQSGHVIFADYATTGDGVLTALQLLAEMATSKKSLAELAQVMQRLPQVLINVKNVDKAALATNPKLQSEVQRIEKLLAGNGRVLLRPSGTEPVVRVMVEATSSELAESYAAEIAELVQVELAI